MGKQDDDEDKAATKIQASWRGKKGRKAANKKKKGAKKKKSVGFSPGTKLVTPKEKHAAAAKIQAVQRGKKERKEQKEKPGPKKEALEVETADDKSFWDNIFKESSSEEESDEEQYDMEPEDRKLFAMEKEELLANGRKLQEQADKTGKIIKAKTRDVKKRKLNRRVSMLFGKDKQGAYMRRWDKRKIQDFFFLWWFIVYWICMIIIERWVNGEANYMSLLRPSDSAGLTCGLGTMEDYPIVFYAEPLKLMESELGAHFCVKACPGPTAAEFTDAPNPSEFICPPTIIQPTGYTDKAYIPKHGVGAMSGFEGPCYKPYGPMVEVMFSCIPKVDTQCVLTDTCKNSTNMATTIMSELGSQHFIDIYDYRFVIFSAGVIALVCSLVWIKLLDVLAAPLVYGTIFAAQTSLILLAMTAFLRAGTISSCVQMPAETGGGSGCLPAAVTSQLSAIPGTKAAAFTVGCGLSIFALIMLCVVLIFKNRIYVAVGVIEEASDAFLEMPQIVLLPTITNAWAVLALVYNLRAMANVLAMGEPAMMRENQLTDTQQHLLCVLGFGTIWTQYVIEGVQLMTISGAIGDWYFTFKDKYGDKDIDAFPVLRSFARCLAFNLGSVCFGSFLITVITIIKWAAVYAINQVMAQSPENKVIQWLGRCLICAIHCVDKFLRYMGTLAYIECSIYNCSFCKGIKNASSRLLKNMVRFSFLTVFAAIIILLGKIVIVAGTTLLCCWFMLIYSANEDKVQLTGMPIAPGLLCGLIAAVVAHPTMEIYNTAVDTIMISFLEDEAENVGEKPSFASGSLARFMKGTKKIADIEDMYKKEVIRIKTNRIRAMEVRENILLKKNVKKIHQAHTAHKQHHLQHMTDLRAENKEKRKQVRSEKKRSAKERKKDRYAAKGKIVAPTPASPASPRDVKVQNPMFGDGPAQSDQAWRAEFSVGSKH